LSVPKERAVSEAADIVLDGARARLMAEALKAFARDGFEGASTRTIATAAGVNHSLIPYYFGSKDGLWRAATSGVLDAFLAAQHDSRASEAELSADIRLKRAIEQFVWFSSEHPEFHRLLTAEWAQGAPRIQWLAQTYILPLSRGVMGLIVECQTQGFVVPGDPARLLYGLIGIAATAFAMAPEYQLLTGQDPRSDRGREETVALVERLLFVRHSAAAKHL
jgi:TetR/AcrR family transcriptional regulator